MGTDFRPVGHLVNLPDGPFGTRGIGYDYVLAGDGLYVESESLALSARLLVTPTKVRGLAPLGERLVLVHGPIPAHMLAMGLNWFAATPGTERFFAICWESGAYRLVIPDQQGTATSLTYEPPAGVVAEFHSHGRGRAFFSSTDNEDEQAFRIYGVAGRNHNRTPELNMRLGIYGHFRPVSVGHVFDGPVTVRQVVDSEDMMKPEAER